MRKICLLLALFATLCAQAQDPTAMINKSWAIYAGDTGHTYIQIINKCDSEFALAGYSAAADTVGDTTEFDGSPYVNYLRWKGFWAGRWDVATGKIHDFSADAMALISSGVPANCAGTSALQSSLTSGPAGWRFIGPRNITAISEGAYGNSLHQHLGQVNEIVINPANANQIYIRDEWGGLWKTTNGDGPASAITWTCLSDHLPAISGIGITSMHIDFTSTPHKIYCVVAVPYAMCMANVTNYNPHTAGIFYSTDDGATFNVLDISAAITDLAANPILAMKYWPGNGGPGDDFIFITTPKKIYRLNITVPTLCSA